MRIGNPLRVAAALAATALLAAGLLGVGPAAAVGLPSGPAAEVAPHQPGVVLVAFEAGVGEAARATAHGALGGSVAGRLPWQNLDIVRLPAGVTPAQAAVAYGRHPLVDFAEPNYLFRAAGTPNDASFSDLYGLHNTGQTGGTADADIDAPEAWTTTFGAGSFPSTGGVRVGIVDTGIDQLHADLAGKTKACAQALTALGIVTTGACADDNLHGTHVAGTVAALTNNARGVAGVAPNAELAVFKALNAAGVGFTTDIVAGIKWLRTTGGARIISMSLGSAGSSSSLAREVKDATNAGVLLIAAAGNDGDDTLNYPAAYPEVVSVAATDDDDRRASFSNCNADVEIAAPGVSILSTIPGGAYARLSGTSMATPHVSGAAALVMWHKGTTAADTRQLLTSTADDKGPAGTDSCFGAGRLNLSKAVA